MVISKWMHPFLYWKGVTLAFRARLACKDLPRLAHNQHSGKRRLDSDTELFKPGLSTLKG